MKFYLQSLNARDFLEVNQALTLSGVYTEPTDFTRSEVNVNETLKALLEVMSEDQSILVYGISNGFRNMLDEGKHLQMFSKQLVLTVPADVNGYMTLKASKRMGVNTACGRVFELEQAVVAMHNGAQKIVLDLEKIGRFASAMDVLGRILAEAQKSGYPLDDIIAVCATSEQLRQAMAAGARSVGAPRSVYDNMLYSVLTGSETAAARDEWILTYTRPEVLDREEH